MTMLTNMNLPNHGWSTISPGLLQERVPTFMREAHQLKLTLKPIPGTPNQWPESDRGTSQ